MINELFMEIRSKEKSLFGNDPKILEALVNIIIITRVHLSAQVKQMYNRTPPID